MLILIKILLYSGVYLSAICGVLFLGLTFYFANSISNIKDILKSLCVAITSFAICVILVSLLL